MKTRGKKQRGQKAEGGRQKDVGSVAVNVNVDVDADADADAHAHAHAHVDSDSDVDVDVDIDVLFDESDVLVVDKPPGLDMDELRRAIREAWRENIEPGFDGPSFLGRLDRPTSGVVVAALSRSALAALEPHWRARDPEHVVKEYLVVVDGNVKGSEGVIDFPLAARSERLKGSGRIEDAKTSWKKLDGNVRASLLIARLHTGKTHQIRRHMKAFKHPVVGDARYGGGEHAGGLLLHAWRLSHDGRVPVIPRVLEAPVPERMRSACRALGLPLPPQ